jgi:type II secretory pathway predicted ATPase ExeA
MMPHTREALAGLEYGISERKGFTVLTGEVGTGKTTLLRCALGSLGQRRVSTSFVFNPLLDPLDFLEFVLTDFGLTPNSRTKSGMLLQLNRWLIERFRMHETCVVVVDEAQNLSWELLEEIRLLTNLESSSEKLLQIVLSGQTELEEKLRHPSVRQLRQRIFLWCRTQALTAEQTGEYIVERLRIAGTSEMIFSPEAIQVIYSYSRGIPRTINLICEHSLILGYVEQIRLITPPLIAHVAADLELDIPSYLMPLSQPDSGGLHNSLHSFESGANKLMNSFNREPGESGQ